MNAKEEFLLEVSRAIMPALLCAYITREHAEDPIVLKQNYTSEEFETFLNNLDFEYDNGYGTQELFGMVWFVDGTWLTRGEYDGSEWWEYHRCPNIVEECKR